MKKTILGFLMLTGISLSTAAQAVLPASWSFQNTSFPVGWTSTGTTYYSASGNTPPALKFDNTADDLIINFASNPGNLTYFITGNSFSGGTFSVEESANGSAYTTLRTFTSPPAGTYTQFTDVPLSTSRFIRFIYTVKASGNIGLDDVSIAAGAATPEQEINVKVGTTTIVDGGTQVLNSPVATTTPTTFTVENLGTVNDLIVSGATITGANAADFVISATPTTIGATTNGSLTVDFTPTAAGNRNAVLTINSNDVDEPSYVINLYGVGGSFATEPASQATGLAFSNVKSYRLTGSFTPAAGSPEGYLVLRKTGSAITSLPTDGTVYQRGDIVGDAQVVYSGTATGFTPNNIIANTNYNFTVFTYNGPGVYRNYNTTAPLSNATTTPATLLPAGYYAGINTASPSFVADLHALVFPHQLQFYSNYGPLMIKLFATRDTVGDQRVVTCVYSGENKVYTEPFDFTANGFSREHTFAFSWMPTSTTTDSKEYSDYHNLYPTNQDMANAVRSNYPLGEVVTVSSSYLQGKLGLNANNRLVYEPREEQKGDAARAIMYESIAYTTEGGNSWAFPDPISASVNYGQDQYLLKQWHFQDPPSNFEMSRNDYVDSLQGNRNPFTDSIDFACYVNFYNMTYETAGCFASVEEALNAGFVAYPNPAKDVVSLHVDATTISSYEVIDIQGKTVLSGAVENQVLVKLPIQSLKTGSYIIKVTTPYGVAQRNFVKN